jgi:hypothetical protein
MKSKEREDNRMNIGNNDPFPATWNKVAEKLSAELEHIKSYEPPDADINQLRYFRAAAAIVHRHLLAHRISADLYEPVYQRDKALGEIIRFWMDEAVRRDGDTRDKEAVAAISVNNWLEQVRREEREFAIKTLRLDKRSLVFSDVTLSAKGSTISFLAGGIPDTHNIGDNELYQEFVEGFPDRTLVTVAVDSFCVGTGESESADDDEVTLLEEKRYLIDLLDTDSVQSSSFAEYVRSEAYDYL